MKLERSHTQALTLAAAAFGTYVAIRAAKSRQYDFAGKVVLITGGSRGLGLVIARQLAREGARLVLVARDDQELEEAAADIRHRDPGVDVMTVPADVRKRYDVERAVALVIDRFGRVDVAINNAGTIQVGPMDHMAPSDYDDAMNTHFWGPLHVSLAVIPYMRRQGGGRITNISSIGGRIAIPHMVPYSASKFALSGFSDGLRAELGRDNIAVTSVYPGLMRTGSPVNAQFKGRRSEEYAWFAIADSLPGLTISAERAANQILMACRRGDAELVITVPAKLAILARTVAPELFARAISLVNRLLPMATGPEGDRSEDGRSAGSASTSSKILAPMYVAAQRNNEL
jgi:NAD(P)-dependent dehydrogenase (short-subunit alcohol dehydrogenase family)